MFAPFQLSFRGAMKLISNFCTLFVYFCLTNLASTSKFEQISDCYLYDLSTTSGIDNVTFTCTGIDHDNLVFTTSNKLKCSNTRSYTDYKRPGTIDFRNCRLPTIKRNYFEMFHNMHTFIISNVELETLQMDIFREAKNVTKLDVSQNNLNEIPRLIFFNAVKLKHVTFFNNSIKRVDPTAFEGAIRLETLNLSHNQINEIDSRTFTLPNLLVLDLSNNNLTKLDDHTFDKLVHMKQLNLSFNTIGNLNMKTFIQLINLEDLNLRRANISHMQSDTFSHQYKLVSLDLSENSLKKLDFNLFLPILHDLQSLRLSKNQLKDLNGFRNSLFPQLKLLDVQGNQFNCSYLAQFMVSINWEKIHLHLDVSSIDANSANKSNIRGISCATTYSREGEDGETTFNEQIAVKTTHYQINENTPKFSNFSNDPIKNFALMFLCIAFTIFVFLYIVANLNKLRSQLPCPLCFQRVTNHSSEDNAVDVLTYKRVRKHWSKENVVELQMNEYCDSKN